MNIVVLPKKVKVLNSTVFFLLYQSLHNPSIFSMFFLFLTIHSHLNRSIHTYFIVFYTFHFVSEYVTFRSLDERNGNIFFYILNNAMLRTIIEWNLSTFCLIFSQQSPILRCHSARTVLWLPNGCCKFSAKIFSVVLSSLESAGESHFRILSPL